VLDDGFLCSINLADEGGSEETPMPRADSLLGEFWLSN
jgi:hypothetical protein